MHITRSLKKIGETYKLQPCLLKQEMEHDENYEDTREAGKHEWLLYNKNDVLPTAFCYVRYIMAIEEIKNFGLKTVQLYRV